MFAEQSIVETQAVDAATTTGAAAASEILRQFHERTATGVQQRWWDFFFEMAGRFRDMYEIVDVHAENFNYAYRYIGVPRYVP